MTKATTKPIRIQRKRAKGWRLPPNTVYVGRPTKWGNPFYVGHPNVTKGTWYACDRNQEAKERYALHVYDYFDSSDFHELRGKNLACWCALDQPCHADILLGLANG